MISELWKSTSAKVVVCEIPFCALIWKIKKQFNFFKIIMWWICFFFHRRFTLFLRHRNWLSCFTSQRWVCVVVYWEEFKNDTLSSCSHSVLLLMVLFIRTLLLQKQSWVYQYIILVSRQEKEFVTHSVLK